MDRQEQSDLERQQLFGGWGHSGSEAWPTVDGPVGISGEESVGCARRNFLWGFALLPFLWGINCFYFWPVLIANNVNRDPSIPPYFHRIRPYVVRSAIGFAIFTLVLTSWVLTFMIGGEQIFGPVWQNLVMYNAADKLGLTGWM